MDQKTFEKAVLRFSRVITKNAMLEPSDMLRVGQLDQFGVDTLDRKFISIEIPDLGVYVVLSRFVDRRGTYEQLSARMRESWFYKYQELAETLYKAVMKSNNDWELKFVGSCAEQLRMPILGTLADWTRELTQEMFSEPLPIERLTDKQREVLTKILNREDK